MPIKILIALLLAAAMLILPDIAAAADAHAGDATEVRMALPRSEDGAIDIAAILNQVRTRIAAGAREILFRGDVNPTEARRLFLQGRLIEDIAARLPDDGVEREVRVRGMIDARVQRAQDGELRARIEGVHLGTLGEAQRRDLARRVALQAGVHRVRIHGLDATGERVRVDYYSARPERVERARIEHIRVERAERVERPERAERPDRPERIERVERPERVERVERPHRPERVEKPERSGRR
jgi:hypothetical protein